MQIIQTADLRPQALDPSTNHQVYCGLDNCVMVEIREELERTFPVPGRIYEFKKSLQGPYLEIMLRGFLVDQVSRRHASEGLRIRVEALQQRLNTLSSVVWDGPLNARSHEQLKAFFYGRMKLPEVWQSQKGQRKLSMNREALEKLETYLYARPFVSLILLIRDLSKQREVLETEIDADERYRTSYNIAGTETGRPSSSENAWGTGGNAQNIAPSLRYVFVADRGKKLCQIDFEQVEARDLGFFCGCLFNDWTFLDAAETGDLHTTNSRLIWPEKAWTGDLKTDRKIADEIFYRDFTYRDMSKRGGHLTDYMGTAWTMARALKIPQPVSEDFQKRFCRGENSAYPCIPRFWRWTGQEIQTKGFLTTPFGFKRHFFGRVGDDTTLREAIAFLPQGTTAQRANLALWRIWKHMPQVQLLGQGYDSVTFQFSERVDEREIIAEATKLCRVELKSPQGRSYIVPSEAKVGWNWGNASKSNPEGLLKFDPVWGDQRKRKIGLQRVMI